MAKIGIESVLWPEAMIRKAIWSVHQDYNPAAGMRVAIRRLTGLDPAETGPLLQAAAVEQFGFVQRLYDEYHSGANRFSAPGELLLAAYAPELLGLGGLNRDPYLADQQTGRLRHLYVLPAWRRYGIGRLLVQALIAAARPHFQRLTLRTTSPQAAAFYRALGFQEVSDLPTVTHLLMLNH